MKHKILIFTFCFLICYFRLSAEDTWVQTYRPFQQPYMTDRYTVEDVIITQDGGYVISGSYELYDEFYYEHWGFLMKTDSDGNMLWAVNDSLYFMSETDCQAFIETEEGDFISAIVCYFGGTALIKRDCDGNRIWVEDGQNLYVHSINNINDGNIILGGRYNTYPTIRKVTPNGDIIWSKDFYISGSGSGCVKSVTETSDGGFVATGYTSGNGFDIFVLKTNSTGDSLWSQTFDGYGDYDQGNCVIETNDGNVLAGGFIEAPAPVYGYGFLAYIYDTGDTLWTKQIPATTFSPFLSLIDDTNNIIAYGGSYGESKLIKIDFNGDIILEQDIYGYRPSGDKCFQKIENGYIFLSREGLYNSIIALIKTDVNGNVNLIDDNIYNVHNYSLINYPNPFNPETTIKFELPINIRKPILEIFNVKGQLIDSFTLTENQNSLQWNAEGYSSGIYLYRIKSDGFVSRTKKMTLIK